MFQFHTICSGRSQFLRISVASCVTAIAVLGFSMRASLGDMPPEDIASLHNIYALHLAEYEGDYNQEIDTWIGNYRAELARLVAATQQAGDLDAWQASLAESRRFENDKIVPEETLPDAHELIVRLHERQRIAFDRIGETRTRKTRELTTQYLARLTTLQIQATRAGNAEQALAYNAEIKRIQALNPEPEAPEEEEGEANTPAEAPSPAIGTRPVPENVVITEGATPTSMPGVSMKPLPLTVTDRMRVARQVSIRGERGSTTTAGLRGSAVRGNTSSNFIQLSIRSTTSAQVFDNATLVVYIYAREASGRRVSSVARHVDTHKVPLPTIDSKRWVNVQLPEINTEMTSFRGGPRAAGLRYGQEFYGIITSVFASDGSLLYQGVSTASLAAVAPTTMPVDENDHTNPTRRERRERREPEAVEF